MVSEKLNAKVIKDLEFMAKKLKKRIAMLEKINPINDAGNSGHIALLIDEYRKIKREIAEISNMTFIGGRKDG